MYRQRGDKMNAPDKKLIRMGKTKHASRPRDKMNDTDKKLILGVTAIGVTGGALYFLGSQLIKSSTGAVGGSCSQNGSPCNTATTPYKQQFQLCANKYALMMSAIIKANKATGSGITTAQQNILNQLTTCMNYNASQIAKVAHQYEPSNALNILFSEIGSGIMIAVALVGAGVFVSTVLKTRAYTGTMASKTMQDAVVNQEVTNGNITGTMAQNISGDISAQQSDIIAENSAITETMVTDDIITGEIASELDIAATDAIIAIDAETIDELAGVFE